MSRSYILNGYSDRKRVGGKNEKIKGHKSNQCTSDRRHWIINTPTHGLLINEQGAVQGSRMLTCENAQLLCLVLSVWTRARYLLQKQRLNQGDRGITPSYSFCFLLNLCRKKTCRHNAPTGWRNLEYHPKAFF